MLKTPGVAGIAGYSKTVLDELYDNIHLVVCSHGERWQIRVLIENPDSLLQTSYIFKAHNGLRNYEHIISWSSPRHNGFPVSS